MILVLNIYISGKIYESFMGYISVVAHVLLLQKGILTRDVLQMEKQN